MARVDATAAKAAAATAAADVTTILQDDTLTELATENKPNHSPMRNLAALFLVDPETGAVTANDDYIDANYAGDYPTSGIDSGRQSQGPRTAPVVVTATIETAAPANIVITYDTAIYSTSEVIMAGAGVGAKTIISITIAGAVVTITASADFIIADVVTVSGSFFGAGVHDTLTAQAITNNIA